jgi:hypothetical protein
VNLWLPYGQAGRAIDQAWPLVRVYAYGNDAALGPAVVTDYVRIAAGVTTAPSALTLLAASGTAAVITPTDQLSAELQALGWTAVATAAGETLFTRPGTARAALPCATG